MKSLIKSFLSFLRRKKLPSKEDIRTFIEEPFSLHKGLVYTCAILSVIFFLLTLLRGSYTVSVEEPAAGGSLTVGLIGAPRFINPLIPSNQSDQTLVELLYSPLVTEKSDGVLDPVLADHFIVSPDGKEYRFTLKSNLRFSNKKPLSSSDVVYTFETKRALMLETNPESSWVSISVAAPDNQTVLIRGNNEADLKRYVTLPIMPASLWSGVELSSMKDSILNMNPVGAGAFTLKKVVYENTVPKTILLEKNPFFVGKKPFIKKMRLDIFSNQLELKDAALGNNIQLTTRIQHAFIDSALEKNFSIQKIPTKEAIGIFVSDSARSSYQNQLLSMLDPFIDRKKIIDMIGNGYGVALPSLTGQVPTTEGTFATDILKRAGFTHDAQTNALLKSGAQVKISLALKKDEVLIQTANELSKQLLAFGIMTELKVFDQGLFAEQVREGGYQFIIGSSDDTIPGYQVLIPLYKTVIPTLTNGVTIQVPPVVESESDLFKGIPNWYVRSDMVWKIFKK